jgi:hypothetical protein
MELLFPTVSLLPDVLNSDSDEVPPARDAAVHVVAVVELCLRVQVVLGQRLLVTLELLRRHRFARLAI